MDLIKKLYPVKNWILFFFAVTVFILFSGFKREQAELKVMTFNIRYDNPEDGKNRWNKRAPVVQSYLLKTKPDVIGMQEVVHNQLLDLSETLVNYDFVGKAREDGNQKGEYCPVFFRKDKFELVENSQFWLSETPEVPGSKSWDAAITRIVTWAKLRHKLTGKEFFVFNTHFDHKGIVAKQMSTDLMSEKITKIAGDAPIIVTGDFNIRKNVRENHDPMGKALYYNLVGTFNDFNSLRDTKTISKLPSKTLGATGTRNFRRDSSFIGAAGDAIDYIFVNEHFEVQSYNIDRVMKEGIFISDHWPVVSVVRF